MNNDFLFRVEMMEAMDSLPEKDQEQLLTSIIEYGCTGAYNTVSPVVDAMMKSFIPGIDSSKQRYDLSILNGKKGGRPRSINYIDAFLRICEGRTNGEIAREFGVSVDTVRRVLSRPDLTPRKILINMKNSLKILKWVNWYVRRAVEAELDLIQIPRSHRFDPGLTFFKLHLRRFYILYLPYKVPPRKSKADKLWRAEQAKQDYQSELRERIEVYHRREKRELFKQYNGFYDDFE